MKEMRLSEIKERCNSSEAKLKKELIRTYVRSKPDFSPGRKRSKDIDEARILAGFKRK
jgi:hypothetical protein